MGSTTRKFVAALGAAAADPIITERHPRWRNMNRERLYHVLQEQGYAWDSDRMVWSPRTMVEVRTKKGVSLLQNVAANGSASFHVRILCPRQHADGIENELFQLAEALGWYIARSPREYENEPGGSWVRRYYQVQRKAE